MYGGIIFVRTLPYKILEVKSMKLVRLLTVAFLLFSVSSSSAQDNGKAMNDALNQIPKYLKEGNALSLGQYFGSSVSLDILGTESMYSKDQAVQVLKSFFSKYQPKSFTIPYKSGGQQLKYIVGNLATQSGDAMRVSIFIKQDGENIQIQKMIVEKD